MPNEDDAFLQYFWWWRVGNRGSAEYEITGIPKKKKLLPGPSTSTMPLTESCAKNKEGQEWKDISLQLGDGHKSSISGATQAWQHFADYFTWWLLFLPHLWPLSTKNGWQIYAKLHIWLLLVDMIDRTLSGLSHKLLWSSGDIDPVSLYRRTICCSSVEWSACSVLCRC